MSGLLSFKNISRLLTLLAIALLVWLLYTADLLELLRDLNATALLLVAGSSIALTAAWFALAAAWTILVHRLAATPKLSKRRHAEIYARTQIQKYLPGNVFHYLLRHLHASRAGEDDEPLFWACVGELLGQIIAACIVAALALSFALTLTHGLLLILAVALVVVAIIIGLRLVETALPVVLKVLVRAVGERGKEWYEGIDLHSLRLQSSDLLAVLPLHSVYVIAMGVVAWTLSFALEPFSADLLLYVVGVTSLAWVVGFILPGAPGGMGPREAFLAAALTPISSVEIALFVALTLRLCSILSDLLFYGVGMLAISKNHEAREP